MNYIIELAQLQNELHVPAKDKVYISTQFRVTPRTNLLHTYTHTHTYIQTYAQTFSGKRIFRLRDLRNIENHRNLGVEKFHRYQAFSLRKQNMGHLQKNGNYLISIFW